MAATASIKPGSIIRGPTLPEPVEVLAVVPLGDSLKVVGRGLKTGLTHDPVLSAAQLAQLTVSAMLTATTFGTFLREFSPPAT